jgi:hypothetical protein
VLSPAQVEVLLLMLEKEQSVERDEIAHGLRWLAIIAAVSPLLGLLGTVLGVMNSFPGMEALTTTDRTAAVGQAGAATSLTCILPGGALIISRRKTRGRSREGPSGQIARGGAQFALPNPSSLIAIPS